MFDIDRILAIPDESVDYLQMGISGGERAALKDRGFVRKDGIKAKDYMIRTIQKTEKNKAKAEKAVIKGDKPLSNTNGTFLSSNSRNAERQDSMKKDMEVLKNTKFKYNQGQKATVVTGSGDRTKEIEVGVLDSYVQDGQVRYTVYPKGKKSSVGSHFWVKESDLTPVASTKKQSKSKPENTPIAPDTAKKIKAAIAGVKGGKVVKGVSPRDRASFISKSLQNTLGENNFLVKNKHEGVKLIEDAIKNNRGNLEADSMGKLQVLKINKPSKKFPYGSASIVVDNSTLGKGYGRERSTVDLVYLADNARKLAKKQDSASPMDRLEQLVKLGDELKPKQQSAAQKMNMTDAEYAAFKKKVKRL